MFPPNYTPADPFDAFFKFNPVSYAAKLLTEFNDNASVREKTTVIFFSAILMGAAAYHMKESGLEPKKRMIYLLVPLLCIPCVSLFYIATQKCCRVFEGALGHDKHPSLTIVLEESSEEESTESAESSSEEACSSEAAIEEPKSDSGSV